MRIRPPRLLPFLFLLLVVAVPSFAKRGASESQPPRTPSIDVAPLAIEAPPAFVLLGGGYDPVSNQISISQDLEYARSILAGPGISLFAAGAGSPVAIHEEDRSDADLDRILEDLLGDPAAASIRFRRSSWTPDGPSTAAHALDLLKRALTDGDTDLLVYGAGHGEPGESPQSCGLTLWGGWSILAEDLGELLDEPTVSRPLHLVLTSCFSGGFADIAVHGGGRIAHEAELTLASLTRSSRSSRSGEHGKGPVHCGLFAAPWDDESSGCDPNPDRAAQESYALHFLRALIGEDRDGKELPLEMLDLDGDGRIGLLEAHTRARIATRSIDMPTTTSEHWLRLHRDSLPPVATYAFELLPEEQAVVARLGSALGLDTEPAARKAQADLDRRLEELADLTDEAQLDADDAYWALRITLLERWPELSKAWSREASERVRSEHDEILELVTESEPALRYERAMARWEERAEMHDKLRLQRSLVSRVTRAWETLALAGSLRRIDGPAWQHYLDLLSCERWAPETVER